MVKKSPSASTVGAGGVASNYIVDTLLRCSTSLSRENGSRSKPCPPRADERREMHVVPVPMRLLCGLSSIRIAIPSDLRPSETRQNVLFAVQELGKRYLKGLPKLHPLKDMGIKVQEVVDLVRQLEDLDSKLCSHPLHEGNDAVALD